MVEVGQEVEVEVLDVDLERERVSLSLKATQEDPWRQFARSHQIGELIPGRVTKLPFGPSSGSTTASRAWSTSRSWPSATSTHPEQVVSVGEEITVKVIDADLDAAASPCRSSRPPRTRPRPWPRTSWPGGGAYPGL